ncbi:MAG: hypothetical protein IT204_15785 [Fimbriimonadaceae bacterium]|nr:hypothetical protein [Fimbriimonadaceae bacterium]
MDSALVNESSQRVIDLTGSWALGGAYSVSEADLDIRHTSSGLAATLPVGWRVHLPTHSGVRYTHIPEGWSTVVPLATQCVVFENGRRFINLTCREPEYAPCELEVASDGGRAQLTWHFPATQPPLFRCLTFDCWADLIDDHRDWMAHHAGVQPFTETAPEWLQQCPLVVFIDIETLAGDGLHHSFEDVSALAQTLAEVGAPAGTLVYLTTWNAGWERSWPTYEASRLAGGLEALAAGAAALHQHGYRLMLHANLWGVSPYHPEYTSLVSSTVHNRAGHLLGWREFHRHTTSEYHYLRPDARAYRELFWGSLGQVVADVGPDALYLDQTGLLVDDPTFDILASTRRLLGIIKQDCPDLVLGGQVLTSRLCDLVPLWQLWGTPWSGHGWGQPFRRRSSLLTDLFRGSARFCAHLHLPAAVPGRFLWTHEAFANDLGMVGGFLAAQEDNSYHNAIPSLRLNYREHGVDQLSYEVIEQLLGA